MATDSVLQRLTQLELRVTALERLPSELGHMSNRLASVESQVSHLRQEMASEFSATRRRFDAIDARFERLEEVGEDRWAQTRALFEDVIQRIATLAEARPSNLPPTNGRRKRR